MKIKRESIQNAVRKVIYAKAERALVKKRTGLTPEDKEMFDRIFNKPLPEATYQPHFALEVSWKQRNIRKMKRTK